MVVEPKPWSHVNNGSYLTLRTPVMRCRGSRAQIQELRTSDLSRLHLGLSILGKTAWKVNEPVFEVIEHLWNNGGGIADLPPRQNYVIPPEPENFASMSFEERRTFMSTKNRVDQMNRDLHSNRSGILVRLKVAREFIGTKMYFPHNVDFRGRAYPLPPHLNHLGPDVCRGMLLFADGKPLGQEGLRWIKIHLANLCGKDKLSFDDRVTYVEKNMDNILDSAERPLDGNRWWLSTDSPFQVLAACIDLKGALSHTNPEDYISYLPIHQVSFHPKIARVLSFSSQHHHLFIN
jgi:DNA-directed RNA polymerase